MGVDELSESMIALGLGRGTSKADGNYFFIKKEGRGKISQFLF